MKVKLTPVITYQVALPVGGRDLGLFTVASRWEGFVKLTDAGGQVLIVAQPTAGLAEAMAEIFNPSQAVTVEAIKASPDLLPGPNDWNPT